VGLDGRLQWNTWLTLDEASVFLESSRVNIQALMLLATHGQETSPPSLCWTLISHACRMAQALALHRPTASVPEGSEEYLQRNSLFWNLFILDKSLSLSFGRPLFLESSLYVEVPLPDQTQLAKYKPHKRVQDHPSSRRPGDDFGPFFFQQHLKLSKIMGSTTALLERSFEYKNANIDGIKAEYMSWNKETPAVSSYGSAQLTQSKNK
jgi:hypothetical protein